MKTKTFLLVATVVFGFASSAFAQETLRTTSSAPLGFGVGAEAMLLGGPSGAAFVYDMGNVHFDGILGFASGGIDEFVESDGLELNIGGRALWVMHRSGGADFSLGGGLGLLHRNPDGPFDSRTNVHLEALAQIRAFIVQNVALSTTLGLGVNLNDGYDNSVIFNGQFLTSAGLVYFFQ